MAHETQSSSLEWPDIRDAVWDDCFRAKTRSRYYRAMARKLGTKEKFVGVFALVAQSAVVVSMIAKWPIVAGLVVLVATVAGGAAIVGQWAAERAKYKFAASLADNQEHAWDALWRRVKNAPPDVDFNVDFRRAQTRDNEIMALLGEDDGQNRTLLSKIEEQLTASLNPNTLAPVEEQPGPMREIIMKAIDVGKRG